MSMKPLISIVIPVYNAEKTLERCVGSVLRQSFCDFEAILIDDGSEDRSGAICDKYASGDQRIRVVHQSNRGVSCARNAGIAMACGTYITFLDSDDWLLDNTLSTYVSTLDTCTCDVVIGGLTVYESNKKPYSNSFDTDRSFGADLWETMCRNSERFGYAGGKIVRSSIVKNNGILFNANMNSQEDLDFFLSVYEYCDRVCAICFAGYQYDYVQGKRVPPFWDFIANQLKLLRIAQKKANPSGEAIACVHKRILSLLYTGLYVASGRDDYAAVVQRVVQLEGLTAVLKTAKASGEQGFIAQSFAAGKYDRIRRYFVIRNRIRDIVRNIRKTGSPER